MLHYYARTPEYIRDNFEVLDSITFDTEDFSIPTPTNNCATGGISPKDPAYLESVSSYLFSYPAQRDKHTSPRYSYALYKSLNMPNVSQPGNGYEDWWMKNGLNNVKLYDRRHEQNPDEYGYFLYVDAAEKPGTLATLRLNNDLCPDTRILVTAWVANMQHTVGDASSCLPADIGLTFFGVTKNGERTQINKYYSGSARRPINNGETEWQQIYFYFNFQEGDLVYDSYLLELNNNTSHSNGADYAIDDIKVYRSKVNFGAEQLTPHCDDTKIRMVVYGEYDNLMFTAARNEVEDTNQDTPDGEDFDIYFRFYNQDGSIIRFDYNNEGEGSNTTFGKMKINTCYDEMKEFNQNNPEDETEHDVAYRKTDKAGKRYVVFTTVIPNDMIDGSRPLEPGKTYYVQLQPCPGEDAGGHNHNEENPPAFEWEGKGGKEQFDQFRRTNKCKLISPFTIRKSTTIRLDGVMDVEDAGRLCPGRTVQLEGLVQVYDYMNGKWYPDIKILFDWYIKSGNKETDDKIISLLEEFRRKNPGELGEEELKNLLREDEYNPLYEAAFSEEVKYHSLYFEREEIKYTVSDEDESNSIGLFLFPLKPENWKDVILDAEIRDEDIRWCPNPTEATIEIGGPKLVLGFPEVNYPEDYKAGVRIGKGQVTTLTSKNVVKNELYIPINKVLPSIGVDRLAVGKKDEPDTTSYAVLVDANSETKIAKVSTFQADRGNGEDYLVLDFTENEQPFSPKEGHQYQVRIFFRDAPSDDQEIICEGEMDFFFRIVPEYLTWTGTSSGIANWNSDDAWERSDRIGDLYFTKQDQDPETDLENAFAPMKFTHVTVKKDNSPYLYTAEPDQEKGGVLNLTLNKPEKIGDATKNIEYDLMVKEADAGKDYGFDCEKYYTNTAKEIYFKPEATLMNQQLLTYEKAHVDFEMENGKKYWLASPLQGVVAGDMYAPKLNARQETPAFKPIEFSDEKNDRFNPAFFQRSWDRAVNMYLPGENNRKEYQVVESNWSIEYNDVNVPYSIGKGFYASVEMEMERADNGYKALVRLPKSDTSYGYQTPRTKAVNTTISRENDGHLAEGVSHIVSIMGGNDTSTPTGTPDGDERHFLVGNPYMTHLDMGRFFDQNSFLTRKYWIVEDGIVKAEISKNGEWTGGESGGTVAPMTAFFVEKADQRGGENILFNTDMMVYSAEIPKTKTRTIMAVNPRLSITAERNGKRSRCVITQDDFADNRYDAGEDAVVLLDKQEERYPTVYSIAGNQAAIYNSVKDWKNIPIGIYSDSKEEVTLTFEGMEQLAEPIYLYDALTKERIRLDALNPRVTVPGSTHGRYFLNGTEQLTAENAIAVYSPTPGQLVVAAPAPETLKQIWIYTVAGQLVQAANGLDTSVQTFNLPKGIYMVEATSEQAITKTKVHIR